MEQTTTTHNTQSGAPVVVISRDKFIKLTKNFCIAQYMVTLLSTIVYILDMQYTLTPEDASQYLGIDWPTFKQAMKKLGPRFTPDKNTRIYSIEAMAKVAEFATRQQRLERLKIK